MVLHDNQLHEYTWLIVVGSLSAFGFGWGTGANDVANAFGTSIGAKTITLAQATVIAAIFEFAGALILGRVSTSVIAGGIADVDTFAREPEVYAYGMCCALFVGTFFLYAASYIGLNVSSTHSIIGGIIGFSLVYAGRKGVNWYQKDTSVFPPAKGIVPIVVSWFFTPAITTGFSAIMFFAVRTLVLRREKAKILSLWLLPVFVFLTLWVCFFFVFTKGAAKMFAETDTSWTDHKNRKSGWVAVIIAGGVSAVAACMIPFLRRRIDSLFDENGQAVPKVVSEREIKEIEERTVAVVAISKEDPESGAVAAAVDGNASGKSLGSSSSLFGSQKFRSLVRTISKAATHGISVDVHEAIEEDPIVAAIHARAEVFDPRAEQAFKYLQVFSAICVIFAHGAGDVGYMTGPLSSIWFAVRQGVIRKSFEPPIWIIIVGAAGLVVGLATYGYNVTRAMGIKLSKLSPSRGFCAELSTAMVLMVASQLGLPTSSSQCITGGIIGVGLVEGVSGVNWKQLSMQVGSWVSTLFIMGLGTACVFAQGVYSPSMPIGRALITYEATVSQLTSSTLSSVNSTMYSLKAASQAGVLPNLPYNVSNNLPSSQLVNPVSYVDFVSLDKTLKKLQSQVDSINPFKAAGKSGNGTARAENYFALYSEIQTILNEITMVNLGLMDSTGHNVTSYADGIHVCSSTKSPFTRSACPSGIAAQPFYTNTKTKVTYNYTTPVGSNNWIS